MLNFKTVTKWRKRKGFCSFVLVAGLLTPSLLVLDSYLIYQHQKCEVWNDKGWWNVLWVHWAGRVHAFRAVVCILYWELYKVWMAVFWSWPSNINVVFLISTWILAFSYPFSGDLSVIRMQWQGTFSCHAAKIPQRMREVTFPLIVYHVLGSRRVSCCLLWADKPCCALNCNTGF